MLARGNRSALEVAMSAKVCAFNERYVTTICSQTFVSEKLRFCFQGVEHHLSHSKVVDK
jgi:hypothetical protein